MSFSDFLRQQRKRVPQLPDVDLSTKTILLTGANSGIGLEMALMLASLKPRLLIITARSNAKCADTKEAIEKQTGFKNIAPYELDLERYASISAFANKLDNAHLDMFIANAGVDVVKFVAAESGHEQNLQVNVYGTFFLVALLTPLLERAKGRALIVSSDLAGMVPSLPPLDHLLRIMDDQTRVRAAERSKDAATKQLAMPARYAVSKLLEIMVVQQLAQGQSSYAIATACPGLVKTPLYRDVKGLQGFVFGLFRSAIGRTPREGARAILVPLLTRTPAQAHGKHFSSCEEYNPSQYVVSAQGRQAAAQICGELKADFDKYDKRASAVFE